jgi:hypothetical protein
MAFFDTAIMYLDTLGVTDIILPFILIFAILFAIMEQVKLFGEKGKKFNIIIALAMALGVVIPHALRTYPTDSDPITIINSIIPSSALIIITVVVILIVLALATDMDPAKIVMGGSTAASLVGLLAIIALAIVVIKNVFPAFLPYTWLDWFNDPDVQAIVVMIALFAIVIWFITAEPKKKDEASSFVRFNNWMRGMAGIPPPKP